MRERDTVEIPSLQYIYIYRRMRERDTIEIPSLQYIYRGG